MKSAGIAAQQGPLFLVEMLFVSVYCLEIQWTDFHLKKQARQQADGPHHLRRIAKSNCV